VQVYNSQTNLKEQWEHICRLTYGSLYTKNNTHDVQFSPKQDVTATTGLPFR
jgi:hypothetical protein